ncbi:MAG: phosphoribosyltransferase family protein [Coriobacteriales bacterium]
MPGSEEALLHPEEAFPFAQARAALSFEGGAKKIIRTYKDGDELRLDAVIASLLCAAIRGRDETKTRRTNFCLIPQVSEALGDWSQWADGLTFVPASPEALRRRDFDHMERVAAICARRLGLPLARLLTSGKGALDQRELGRGERRANRSGSFALAADAGDGPPARLLLIDDVFTTGATLAAATQALLDGGVKEVRAVACCRVW